MQNKSHIIINITIIETVYNLDYFMHNKKDILNLEAEISGSGMSNCCWWWWWCQWCNSHCELISLNKLSSLLVGCHRQYVHLFTQVSLLPSLHTSYIKCTGCMRTVLFWVITQRIGLSETSVRNYHCSVCNSLEEHSSHLCGRRLKLCFLGRWLITQLNYFSDIYRVLVSVFHW